MHCTTGANIRTKETSQSCCHDPPTSNPQETNSPPFQIPQQGPTAQLQSVPHRSTASTTPRGAIWGKFTTRERFLLYDPKVQLKTCLSLPVKGQGLAPVAQPQPPADLNARNRKAEVLLYLCHPPRGLPVAARPLLTASRGAASSTDAGTSWWQRQRP